MSLRRILPIIIVALFAVRPAQGNGLVALPCSRQLTIHVTSCLTGVGVAFRQGAQGAGKPSTARSGSDAWPVMWPFDGCIPKRAVFGGSWRTPSPPIQNRTANAKCSRFYARGGGKRSEQIALRSHDADFFFRNLDTLGQGAQVLAATAAAVDPGMRSRTVRANFWTMAGVIACCPALSTIAWVRSASAWA